MSVNKVLLLGRLGETPEIKYTPGGAAVTNFSLATKESFKDKSGEWKEKTEWHRVVVWGKQAESAVKYLQKGREAHVEGRIETRKWTDNNSVERYTTEVISSRVTFVGGGERQQQASSEPMQPKTEVPESTFTEDDIPF